MPNRTLALVLTVLGLAFGRHAAAAEQSPKLILHPVAVLARTATAVRISIDPPCGGQLYGIVAVSDSPGVLKLAAAIAQNNVACASLPDPVELTLEQLALKSFRKIRAQRVNYLQSRLQIAPITSMQQRATKAKDAVVNATYESRCGKLLGTLLRPLGGRKLGIAMIEIGPRRAEGECPIKQRTTEILALSAPSAARAVALQDDMEPAGRTYELRLAPVKPALGEGEGKGGLIAPGQKVQAGSVNQAKHLRTIRYERACNEAPVGVVIARPRPGETHARIGVLVARYERLTCDPAYKATESLDLAQLELAQAWRGALLQPNDDANAFILKSPTQVTPMRTGRGTVRVDFRDDCRAPAVASVYALDQRGKLAVGVLAERRGAYRCKKTASDVSWTEPYLSTQVAAADVFPMKLKGQSAH